MTLAQFSLLDEIGQVTAIKKEAVEVARTMDENTQRYLYEATDFYAEIIFTKGMKISGQSGLPGVAASLQNHFTAIKIITIPKI